MKTGILQNRNFTTFLSGGIITIFGNEVLTFILALYVLSLTGSASRYATVVALGGVPMILLGPVAGSLIDRFNKKKMLMGFDLLNGLMLLGAFVWSIHAKPSMGEIYFIVLILGICNSFYGPASQSIIFGLVDQQELVHANLAFSMGMEGARIIAPSIAILAYGFKGIGFIFLLDALTFFASASALFFVTIHSLPHPGQTQSILSNIGDGFKLYQNKEILSVSLNGMLTHLLVLPVFIVGFPFLIKRVFDGTDFHFGVIQTVYSIGTLAAVVTVPILAKRFHEIKGINATMYGMLAAISILFLLGNATFLQMMKLNHFLMVFLLALVAFLFALTFANYSILFAAFNQRKVGYQFMGRFYSMLTMLFGIGKFFGTQIYGALFDTKIFLYPILFGCLGIVLKLALNSMVTPNRESNRNAVV